MAQQPGKDAITTHVLDTITGLPAANLNVTLLHLTRTSTSSSRETHASFSATTDADGRILRWTSSSTPGAASIEDILAAAKRSPPEKSEAPLWTLQFDAGRYFASQRDCESFWDVIEVRFKTPVSPAAAPRQEGGGDGKGGEEQKQTQRTHWHIPLLLGPWSYTTYRGS